MNIKRFILAGIAVTASFIVMDNIIHGLILGETYKQYAHLWRPDMMSLMWIFPLTCAGMSFLYVYIFSKGYEGKGIMEGVRFGVVLGLFMNIPVFGQYAMYPLPFTLVVQWFIFITIEYIIAGIVAAAVYKPKE